MPTINACLPCRKVKMKCITTGQTGTCDRCTRKSLQCVFREHCRGRKPGMRLTRKERRPDPVLTQQSGSDFWTQSDGFQPHGLLSHQAMKGKFSLQNILSVDHEPQDSRPDGESIPPTDPIALGVVNSHVASSLLDYFMQKMNPYISQLDPALHSLFYLRRHPFLLTAVLAVAAKAFQSALYPRLHAHAETLYTDSFKRGEKSTEIIQAILLLTYWKEPNDTRAWTSVGLAIRIAMDLGWHKLPPDSSRKHLLTDTQRREVRNQERTFLVLFVYDRSLSLQTGKPRMIEQTELIDSSEDWWKDDLASPNDQLLCAFVVLRLLTADPFDLLTPSRTYAHRIDRLLDIIDQRIGAWQRKWLGIVSSRDTNSDPSDASCHCFLITFYGLHIRLQLFARPLQDRRVDTSLKQFWMSYHSAIDMMQLVTESSALLYLVQDSIHVMTAYAAIFLIKLLLSCPSSMTEGTQSTVTTAIRDAGTAFSALSAPSNSSCALQTRFLKTVLLDYYRLRDGSDRPHPQQVSLDTTPVAVEPFVALTRMAQPQSSPRQGSRTASTFDRESEGLGFLFEEDMWDDMFANAGFSVQEGVFFS